MPTFICTYTYAYVCVSISLIKPNSFVSFGNFKVYEVLPQICKILE